MEHGSVTVSAGYGADGKSLVTSQTVSYTDSTYKDTLHTRTETAVDTLAVNANDPDASAVASSESGLDVLLKKQDSMKELILSVQQGMHSGVDTYIDINLQKYDSLLTDVLKAHNIDVPHRTLYIYSGATQDSSQTFIDTLGIAGDSTYIPSPKAIRYNYEFNRHHSQRYQLIMEPITSPGMETNDWHPGHFICHLPHPRIFLLVPHPDTAETKDAGRNEEQLYEQHHA